MSTYSVTVRFEAEGPNSIMVEALVRRWLKGTPVRSPSVTVHHADLVKP